MAANDRITLKTRFQTNAIPTAKDFGDLIDSMLNKRDDHFFGVWQPGAKYCKGDVVLFEKSLYMLVDTQNEKCEDEASVQTSPCDDGQSNSCICSKNPPADTEGGNWCRLRFDVDDDDWQMVPPTSGGQPEFMYAEVSAIKVGVGTKTPATRFVVANEDEVEGGTGQILLDPGSKADQWTKAPALKIKNLEENTALKNSVAEAASWTTNAPLGYLFKIKEPANDPKQQRGGGNRTELLLMLVRSKNSRPQVGIATDEPAATLDALWEGKGQVLLQPGEKKDPEILLLNLDPAAQQNYLALTIGQAYASLVAGANRGFRFRSGEAYSSFSGNQDGGKTLVSFHENGKVGIGVENPAAHLHVVNAQAKDGGAGEARISLTQTHPALSLIKFKPDRSNYLSLGPDNDQANFTTDSQEGFLFRKGRRCGQNNSEEKVGDGKELVRIQAPAKYEDPNSYDLLRLTPTLDTEGIARSFGQYIVADGNVCEETGEIDEQVLTLVNALTPVKFRWQEGSTPMGDIGEQFGLRAGEVEKHFSQVVMNGSDRQKAIAYQNLVPVLIKCIQELTRRVEELENDKRKGK